MEEVEGSNAEIDFDRWYREIRKKYLTVREIDQERKELIAGPFRESQLDPRMKSLKEGLDTLRSLVAISHESRRFEADRKIVQSNIKQKFDSYSQLLNIVFREYILLC